MKTMLTLFSILFSVTSFASVKPASVSDLDYYVNLAHHKGLCGDISTRLTKANDTMKTEKVLISVPSKKLSETLSSSSSASQCQNTLGNRGQAILACKGEIAEDRLGMPKDHIEMPTYCTQNTVEVIDDSNESITSISITQESWQATYFDTCESSYQKAQATNTLETQDVAACELSTATQR
jgi:hypothetical protein